MLADVVCKEVFYFIIDTWIRVIVARSLLESLGTSSRTKSCIAFDTQSCTCCIKSLFISKSNRRKEFSAAGGAVDSDSLILYFSRLGKLCERNRKNICKRARGVVIYITTAKLNSQNSARHGQNNDSFDLQTGKLSLTFPYYLDRPSKADEQMLRVDDSRSIRGKLSLTFSDFSNYKGINTYFP